MKNFTPMVRRSSIKAMLAVSRAKSKVCYILSQKKGENFIESAMKILIAVIIGSALMTGLIVLFKDTIMPTLQERILAIFDYNS